MTQITEQNLQEQVGLWSKLNFGEQVSKFNGNIMGFNNPLLGIIEEAGELHNASSDEDIEDAIADMIIYSCDLCCRLGIELPEVTATHESEDLVSILGDLCHSVLKTHQGIRGYDDQVFAIRTITNRVVKLLEYLHNFCIDAEIRPPMELAVTVFQDTVSKRDWVTNPEEGNNAN